MTQRPFQQSGSTPDSTRGPIAENEIRRRWTKRRSASPFQRLGVLPAAASLEKPPSHLSHLLPEQQPHGTLEATQEREPAAQTGSSRRDPSRLAAAAAIDLFVARQEQTIAAQESRLHYLQDHLAECVQSSQLREEHHNAAIQATIAAREATESDPPKMSQAERRYIDAAVTATGVALTEAKAREAMAKQKLAKHVELARAAIEPTATKALV